LQPFVPWLFLAPALLLFLYFKILPMLQGVKMSFYDVRPYLGDRYVGWGNYVEATTQPLFTKAIWQSAAVDGAVRWRRFVHVTLPALRPVITILCILAALRGLRSFTEVFLLTNGAPNGSTEVVMTLIYKLGLEQGKLGVAAAGSMVLFVATAVVTLAVHAWRRRAALR